MIVLWALVLPLIGFLTLFLFSTLIPKRAAGRVASTTIFLSFALFSYLLFHFESPVDLTFFRWIAIVKADFALRLDTLSLLMALIITGVGLLIHLYSIGYMEHEEDVARFFACLNLFVFAMLLLVLSANLLLLFVGWEGVGLSSYLLVGYYYARPSAAKAAVKAFIINRIADTAFLIALLLTFTLFGTVEIEAINAAAQQSSSSGAPITLLTSLLFIGAMGKSAQLPLHTWLADAMEGPTPVSALIHAATMVTAGVYLIVRMHPLFLLSSTLQIIGVVGAVTALFAALCAAGQTDLKRVLAYSTVSQLGYMFLACGVGAFYAAMFHLTMHAFVKALLFLSAGNVVHGLNGETDMERMGGLYKIFTKTHLLFLIGSLALSGLPPLAIYFSKDLILEQSYLKGAYLLFAIGSFTSALTAFYLIRAYCLTFTGKARLSYKQLYTAREAPTCMLLPVMVLAALAICGGLLGDHLKPFLGKSDVFVTTQGKASWPIALTLLGAFTGLAVGIKVYRGKEYFPHPPAILKNSFYIDEIYLAAFVYPLQTVGEYILGNIEFKLKKIVDKIALLTLSIAQYIQDLQSSQLRFYIAWIILSASFLVSYFMILG